MVSAHSFTAYALFTLAFFTKTWVYAFSSDANDNLAVYWGQDASGNQQDLSYYCNDDTIDAIPIAFLYSFFGVGGEPEIDISNICGSGAVPTFSGTALLNCGFLADDIKTCQAKGKIVTISLGGATGDVGFTSSSQAQSFANTIWNMFLGGSSDTRPFGDAVLDGIDLDIEGGSPSYYADFVNEIRSLSNSASKKYYVTAAPQCPYPDADIGEALNAASFDAVYVQFYNNYCELSAPSEFNFATWDKWAKETSPNPDVKVYIGAPGSPSAAGSGYVSSESLAATVAQVQGQYSSFGGVMLWDASVSYNSDGSGYASQIKNSMSNSGGQPASSTSKVITASSTSSSEKASSSTHHHASTSSSVAISIPVSSHSSATTSSAAATSSAADDSGSGGSGVGSGSGSGDGSGVGDGQGNQGGNPTTSQSADPTSTSSWTDTWWTPTQTVWWTPTQTVWYTSPTTPWWTPTKTVWWTPSKRADGAVEPSGSRIERAVRSAAPEPEFVLQPVPEVEQPVAALNDTPAVDDEVVVPGASGPRRHAHSRFFAAHRELSH